MIAMFKNIVPSTLIAVLVLASVYFSFPKITIREPVERGHPFT